MKSLASLGEFQFIEAIARLAARKGSRRGVILGIGDDAAQLRLGGDAIVTVDNLIEGVHFRRAWLTPAELGRRALRVAVSDIAACGATPRFVLLALSAPSSYVAADALALVHALVRDAASIGATLVGGNLSRAPVLTITVTIIGAAGPRVLTRAAARRGDTIYVSGALGGAAAALRRLEREPARRAAKSGKAALAPYRKPPLRVDLGLRLAALRTVGAAIDVSDGLVQDLAHLCKASGVSAELDVAAVPLAAGARHTDALFGGDDYELLFTARPGAASHRAVLAACRAVKRRAIPIGRIVARRRARVVASDDGRELTGGYTHFAAGRRS